MTDIFLQLCDITSMDTIHLSNPPFSLDRSLNSVIWINLRVFLFFKYLTANYFPFSEVYTFFTSPCVGLHPTSSFN